MASIGDLLMAAQSSEDVSAFRSAQDVESERRGKANWWGGLGRTVGMIGTGIGIASMANPLTGIPLALAIGLGGLGGRSAARAAAGGRERHAEKDIDALFYQGEQEEFKKDIEGYQSGVRERMVTDVGRDALSAFMMQKYFQPTMSKAGTFMKGLPEGLEAGQEMGLNPLQSFGDYAKSFSPDAPFVVPPSATSAWNPSDMNMYDPLESYLQNQQPNDLLNLTNTQSGQSPYAINPDFSSERFSVRPSNLPSQQYSPYGYSPELTQRRGY